MFFFLKCVNQLKNVHILGSSLPGKYRPLGTRVCGEQREKRMGRREERGITCSAKCTVSDCTSHGGAAPAQDTAHSWATKRQETEESPILSASEALPVYTPESPSEFLHFHSPLIPITVPPIVSHRLSTHLNINFIFQKLSALGRKWSCSVISDSLQHHELQPTTLLHPWDFPGKSTGVGCHFLLQRSFLTQGSNPGLPHCRQTLYHLSQKCFLIR